MMNCFETLTDTTPIPASVASVTERQPCCYTVDDLMEILGVGRKAIYALIHKKAFPAIRIMSVGYRIPRESFEAWMHGK